jgi:O-antigen/teichoic acid export membrane protein
MFRDLFETFGANGFLIAFGVLTSIVIARILGPEMRGEFAVILLWSGLFSTFVSLGINESLGYFSGVKKIQRWKYLYTSSIVEAVISLLLIIPLVFLIKFLMANYSIKAVHLGMLSVGFSIFFVPQFMIAQSFLQGRGLIRYLNLINLLNGLLYFFLVFAVWIFSTRGKHNLSLTTSAYIGTYAILYFISFTLLIKLRRRDRHLLKEEHLSFGIDELKNLFKYGFPVSIANLANQATTKLDQIFLSFLVSPNLIGFYAVALSTGVGINASASAVSTIALPRITNARSIEGRSSEIRKLYLSYWYSSIALFLITLTFVPYLVPMLFGSGFAGAVNPSQIVLAGMVFAGANQLSVTVLKALGLPKYAMICRVLALGLFAACLSSLVPKYNIVGAAWAVVLSNFVASIIMMGLIGKKAGIRLLGMIIPEKEDMRIIQQEVLQVFRYRLKVNKGYCVEGSGKSHKGADGDF